jgi:hypothetical protein
MLPSTLEEILKINSEQDCIKHYESIKSNKNLLAQVQSGKHKQASHPYTTEALSSELSNVQDYIFD